MKNFITKDSGKRVDYPSGFRRDVTDNKPRYDLIPGEMLKRLAMLYMRGAKKYGDNNWRKADPSSGEEMSRFKQSAWRHFIAWANGDDDEDHAMAVIFNIFAWETKQAEGEKGITDKYINDYEDWRYASRREQDQWINEYYSSTRSQGENPSEWLKHNG